MGCPGVAREHTLLSTTVANITGRQWAVGSMMRGLVGLSSPRSATTRLAVDLRGTIRTEWDEYMDIENEIH